MVSLRNPFRPTRFEHHEHPLIWVSPNVRKLEGLKSAFLAGARGSGKTSLLKAVDWKQRLSNPSLRDQFNGQEPDYVAVYFRIPDFLSSAIGMVDWARLYPHAPDHDLLAYEFFSTVLELIAAQLICEAFSSLRAEGRFNYSTDEESETVRQILNEYPTLFEHLESTVSGLDQLASALRTIHRRMNTSATRGVLNEENALVIGEQPGVFINDIARRVRQLACSKEGTCSPEFHVKVCIDDCETLTSNQQRYLNSLVRSSQNPLFWVVAYVSGDYDTTSTMVPNQHLTDADRVPIDLDQEDEQSFKSLCEAVTALRVFYCASETGESRRQQGRVPEFSLDSLLGHPSINQLLLQTMRGSLSPEWSSLVERSRQTMEWLQIGDESVPPIYETYVLEKLSPRISDEARSGQTRGLEAYLRRKQRAALLAICSEFRVTNIPYAGSRVVISISDGCIRDYLEIMAVIFDEAVNNRELKSVVSLTNPKKRLSFKTQRPAIARSSTLKFEGIKTSMERDWVEATKVIECLGQLCARIQSDYRSREALATPERGIFVFDLNELRAESRDQAVKRRQVVTRILKRCEADGLLRPQETSAMDRGKSGVYSYRLHRRFAPHFRFSFRGPYAAVKMPMEEFALVCEHPNEIATRDWVSSVAGLLSEDVQSQNALPI